MERFTLDQMVTMLNTMLEADPVRVTSFFVSAHYVDASIADMPIEVAPSAFKDSVELYPLGLINGLVSERKEGETVRRIAADFDESGEYRISRFYIQENDDGSGS